ncbi:MAG: hypothetical protein AYK18_06300 [Theionarchaea archaeon DG-70]|nr:MAG: hypothetical protein AYK18_06300 [Theionarchaea archaeon DG-70]
MTVRSVWVNFFITITLFTELFIGFYQLAGIASRIEFLHTFYEVHNLLGESTASIAQCLNWYVRLSINMHEIVNSLHKKNPRISRFTEY